MSFDPRAHRLNKTQLAEATALQLVAYIRARVERRGHERLDNNWVDIVDLSRELRSRIRLSLADVRHVLTELEDIYLQVRANWTLRQELMETCNAISNRNPGAEVMPSA